MAPVFRLTSIDNDILDVFATLFKDWCRFLRFII